MSNFLVDKQIDELWKIGFALHNFQVSHLRVDELPRNSVKVDFNGAQTIIIVLIESLDRK